ncbi:MAG: hypothetical protein M0R46_17245 [Candidatus Muirbacterium halophilum]|nr:hypothetical protein [Candidatus Muirbacterium halophilum]MCK9477665.1 hypothetical protein [Candidatus Muirbacterium halophilum]
MINIKYIDIMPFDIYIEYVDGNFEYISFTKALRTINYYKPINMKFTISDSEKSSNFLNKLLTNYYISNDILYLKNR